MRMSQSVSRHAVARYMERVDPQADFGVAVAAIEEILATARSRPRPRWWTSRRGERPGTRYLYSARHAGVCLVVQHGVVATVMSRPVCRAWRRAERHLDG